MELTLDQALKKAVEAHEVDNLRQAEKYYTAILRIKPKHPEANYNMGVLKVGLEQVDRSLLFFKNALKANPDIKFWIVMLMP